MDLEEEDLDFSIKAVVVGNGAVGKSSMIQRYCHGVFTNDYKKTIGVDFLEKQLDVNGDQVSLMLWDTAGQEEYDAITRAYYRGANVCVLAFSTVDRESFEAIESWKGKVEAVCGPLIMVLVQNKIDLVDDSTVTAQEVEELAKRLKLRLFRTSVKMDYNINPAFEYLVKKFMDSRKLEILDATPNSNNHQSNSPFYGNEDQPQSNSSTNTNSKSSSFQINPKKPPPKKKFSFCLLL